MYTQGKQPKEEKPIIPTKIRNMHLTYYIDKENYGVHILETTNSNYPRLPDQMGLDLQDELLQQEGLEPILLVYKWFCYCNNAPILRFHHFNLSLVSETDKNLYEPFLGVWDEMRKEAKHYDKRKS